MSGAACVVPFIPGRGVSVFDYAQGLVVSPYKAPDFTATGGSSTTITTSALKYNYYTGERLIGLTGVNAGQVCTISGYTGTSAPFTITVAAVSGSTFSTPNNGDTFGSFIIDPVWVPANRADGWIWKPRQVLDVYPNAVGCSPLVVGRTGNPLMSSWGSNLSHPMFTSVPKGGWTCAYIMLNVDSSQTTYIGDTDGTAIFSTNTTSLGKVLTAYRNSANSPLQCASFYQASKWIVMVHTFHPSGIVNLYTNQIQGANQAATIQVPQMNLQATLTTADLVNSWNNGAAATPTGASLPTNPGHIWITCNWAISGNHGITSLLPWSGPMAYFSIFNRFWERDDVNLWFQNPWAAWEETSIPIFSSSVVATLRTPSSGSLVATATTPAITEQALKTPTPAAVSISGTVPTALLAQFVAPTKGTLTLATDVPGVSSSSPTIASPASGTLSLLGTAPDIARSQTILTPIAGTLSVVGMPLSLGSVITPGAGALALVDQRSLPPGYAMQMSGAVPAVAAT